MSELATICALFIGISVCSLVVSFSLIQRPKKIDPVLRVQNRGAQSKFLTKNVGKKESYLEKLAKELHRSHVGFGVPVYFLIVLATAACVYGIVYYLIESIPVAALCAAAGCFIPKLAVKAITVKRIDEFSIQFSKALKYLASMLLTNTSLIDAMEHVRDADNLSAGVREEFELLLDNYTVTDNIVGAIDDMYERTGCREVRIFSLYVSASKDITNRQLGANLQRFVDVTNDRRVMQAECRADVAETKSTASALAVFPFLVMIMIKLLNPGYFDQAYAWNGGLGKLLILGCYLLTVFGYAFIRKQCDIRL